MLSKQTIGLRRVVVTGMGIVSCLGNSPAQVLQALREGRSGIAFNPSYLKDGLAVVHTDRVVFGFTEPSRPAIMIPEPEVLPEANEDGTFPTPETDFTYLLMPVRLPG